jgi:hypothetical protein
MEQMQQSRPRPDRPRIPAVQCGAGATSRRLDRHLAALGAPAGSQVDSAEAASLIRELTPRGVDVPQGRSPQRESWAAVSDAARAASASAGASVRSGAGAGAAEGAGTSRRARIAKVSLLAPLRKLRRTLFGGR